MKKIKLLLIIIFVSLSTILVVNAATDIAGDCHPAYNGNWTVNSNCNWPDGYKVFGDIVVGKYTITIGASDDMGIDLNAKKITFTTGNINLATTAKIANHVSSRYYISVSYTTTGTGDDCDLSNGGNQCTACPAGMQVFNIEITPLEDGTTTYLDITISPNPGPYKDDNLKHRLVNSSGTFYCGTKGS